MAKKDKTTTTFPKMGEENAYAVAGIRAAGAPQLQYAPRGPQGVGGTIPTEKGAPGRANVPVMDNVVPQTAERLGAKWAPQMLMSSVQAAEAAQTGRNVRLFRSAVGEREFYDKRQYGQVMQ